ncbi:MAG TPA: heavy metal-associated domain-containing protein [Actinotalea sp.]|jgi:copper chaperone CopZ
MTTATYNVDGMTCAHCVHHVTSELTALPGVHDVQIELVVGGSSPVTVTSDAPLDEAAVSAAVVEAGYALTPPRSLL